MISLCIKGSTRADEWGVGMVRSVPQEDPEDWGKSSQLIMWAFPQRWKAQAFLTYPACIDLLPIVLTYYGCFHAQIMKQASITDLRWRPGSVVFVADLCLWVRIAVILVSWRPGRWEGTWVLGVGRGRPEKVSQSPLLPTLSQGNRGPLITRWQGTGNFLAIAEFPKVDSSVKDKNDLERGSCTQTERDRQSDRDRDEKSKHSFFKSSLGNHNILPNTSKTR